MFSRIAFFLTITLAVVATLTVTLSPPALAWTGDISGCSDMPMIWQDAADVVRNQYPTSWIGQNDPSLENYTGIFGKDTSGNMVISWNGNGDNSPLVPTTLTFSTVSGDNIYRMSPISSVVLNSDGTYQTGSINNSGIIFSCIQSVKGNVVYDTSWTDPEFDSGSGSVGGETEPRCDPFDIVCWFGSFVGGIVDGFQSLGDLITGVISTLGEWIANLIMPQNENGEFENRFATMWDDIWSALHDKLGILLFPFEFIADFFTSMASLENPGGIVSTCASRPTPSWCTIGVPNLLGENRVSFNIGALEQEFPALFNTAMTLLRFVWIAGVVAFLHGKYFSVVRS